MEEEYLEGMVQSVAAFQRHFHPVWNGENSFDERIRDLPLYALEFNNYDRDPKKHGPTIAHFAPARQEVIALSKIIIESVQSNIRVLDIGCGNGFIGSLLAREGVPVIGIDNHSWKPPQIQHLFDRQVYELREPISLDEFEDNFNVAFCSWMIPNVNLTPQIVAKTPELIIHIYTEHRQPDMSRQTGCKEAYRCPENYFVLGAWKTKTPKNFFSGVEGRFSINPETIRVTEVWSRRDIRSAKFFAPVKIDSGYYWDKEREVLNKIRNARNLDIFKIINNSAK